MDQSAGLGSAPLATAFRRLLARPTVHDTVRRGRCLVTSGAQLDALAELSYQSRRIDEGTVSMARIPKVLHEHINTAFPANVTLVGTVLPNGFAQISPRGSTMVYDD